MKQVAWHVGLGLGAQFLEDAEHIQTTPNLGNDFKEQCRAWNEYSATSIYKQEDSGL